MLRGAGGMAASLPGSGAPSRQNSLSLRAGSAAAEAASQHPSPSRDMSATDLVRLATQFDAGEAARQLKRSADSSPAQSRTSSVADWQAHSNVSSLDAARHRQAAVVAGQAAGAVNAQNSLPELVSGTGAQEAQDASGRPSSGGSAVGDDLRAGSTRSTASDRASTWLSRVTAKSDDLRKMFDLPETENIMDDFICALQKKLLLQGRMYVFEHYVGFHSNVFGYVKNKTIPLKEVTAVRKRKNLGFPNSIEITWGPQRRKEFFTSFLSREDAFRLIMAAWHQSAPEKAEAQMFSAKSRKLKHPQSATQPDLTSALSPKATGDDDGAAGISEPSFLSRSAALLKKGRRVCSESMATVRRSSATGDLPPHAVSETNGHRGPEARASLLTDRSSSWQEEDNSETSGNSPTTPGHEQQDSDDEGQGESEVEGEMWAPLDRPPPPLANEMQPLVTGELRGITMQELCTRFMSDESSFYVDFHHARGDEQCSISRWRTHHPLGRVRELQFITTLKSRIGPPKTMCYQTQRYAMYQGDQLVFETSQVMPDIPYGDCFTVEARWNISQAAAAAPGAKPSLSIGTHVMVDFTKPTIWRKAIESGVIASCRTAHEEWLAAAQKAIDEAAPQAAPAQAVAAPAAGMPAAASAQFASARGSSDTATPSLGAPSSSPAHLAGLVELLPREHRAAVGRMLRGDPEASVPASPASKRRSSGASSRARGERRPLLSRRQWVLLGLAAAVIGLQLLILWRFAALAYSHSGAGGSGGSRVAVQPPPVLTLSQMPGQTPAFSGGDASTGGPVFSSGDGSGSASEANADSTGWAARLRLLAGDVDIMRRRLELLTADVAAAIASAPGNGAAAAAAEAAASGSGATACIDGVCAAGSM